MLELKRVEEKDLKVLKEIKERAFEEEFHRLGLKPKEMISTNLYF